MIGMMIIYDAGLALDAAPEITRLDQAPTLEVLRELIGGPLQAVPYFHSIMIDGSPRRCVAFCDEEGKISEKPMNRAATVQWGAAVDRAIANTPKDSPLAPTPLVEKGHWRDVLVGTVVILTGDKEFMDAL